ncbi:UvrD-helicase domain-containing protein [Ornithinimicrobium pekingense]|uniref:RecBCD enzyme subunit RecB n=1 Tax=Ornithinimicrobium pekingense TaxID=384677 RepID=A0ABQ2F9G6_9MICO|nr:UvrD-helicase domain-containing protein [Ornithinimicrobium pekingense]GGK71650.1 RecBCD enzyme subunit RecB [Ornithinimicrobium pekingense]
MTGATTSTGAAAPPVTTMAGFDICDPLPTGTMLLEASAGTGKTWTIAALVTRYVAEGVVPLEEMLVVTFSRAASQELRARVREQLSEAEAVLAGRRPADPSNELLTLLLDVDDEERARRHARVRTALTSFDAATIATVHQFCHEVLRSLGVAGTSDASAELVEDLDDLLVEVVDDIYLRGFRSDAKPVFSRREALELARAAVDDVYADLRPTTAEKGSPVARRVGFARAVRAELAVRKRRLQVLHYNDLLTQLADALEQPGSPARDRMRQRWSVVLVDEFQDTDPVQWQVLDRAFSGHARAMVLIGDPKQAIYAFRGGDIVTYLAAAAGATDRRTLPRNFRSDPAVVDALTVMLEGAELGHPQIAVRRVTAARDSSRLRGAPSDAPVRLRQVLLGDHLGDDDRIGPTRAHIARDLALDVAALLSSGATFDGRPVQAHDVAVLAHRGKDLLTAQVALREVGIHAVSAGGSSVLDSGAAHDWLALLEAMAAPHRALLTRGAALTDLLGYAVPDLDAGGEELDDRLAQLARDLAGVYARQGIAAVLERLVAAGLPERVLGQVGGERTLTDIKHVAELLHHAGREDQLGLVALLEWLRAQMAEDGPSTTGARTRRLDSDAAAVQLLTIHGSKGLQFPVVYLPTLTDRNVPDVPRIPLCHDEPPERTRYLDVGGRGGPEWADSVRRHKEEDAGESLRLLYVALTRAQSQVVTWWSPTTRNGGPSPLHRVLFGREPGAGPVPPTARVPKDDGQAHSRLRAWADLGAFSLERADHAAPRTVEAGGAPADLRVGRWTRRIDQGWRRTSYTALSTPRDPSGLELTGGVGSEPEVTPREDEPDTPDPVVAGSPALPGLEIPVPGADVPSPMADLPVGATFGSLVHGVLEHADPQAAGGLRAELLTHIAEQRVQWPVTLDPDELADALVAVCDTPLGPLAGNATLREIPMSDRLRELDFELPLGGGDLRRQTPSAAREPSARVLGDLVPLLRAHLPAGDPVRGWSDVLEHNPELAGQELRGYLTGSVDVVLRTGGRYLVVDYKTNWLGRPEQPLTAADYRPEMLDEAMGHSSYPLQALLYAVVAHRFLRWRLPGYDPAKHLGGVLYLYVRGMCGPRTPVVDGHPCGVFSWRPPVALVTGVSDLLDGRLDARNDQR